MPTPARRAMSSSGASAPFSVKAAVAAEISRARFCRASAPAAARPAALAPAQVVWSSSRAINWLQNGGCLRIVTGVDLRFIPDGTARPAVCQPPEVWESFAGIPRAAEFGGDPDRRGGILSSLRTRAARAREASPASQPAGDRGPHPYQEARAAARRSPRAGARSRVLAHRLRAEAALPRDKLNARCLTSDPRHDAGLALGTCRRRSPVPWVKPRSVSQRLIRAASGCVSGTTL